jgi:hypothetical protein
MTRRGLRKNRGRRETCHSFSRIALGDSHLLETLGKLKGVRRCQGLHLWSVGAVKGIIGTDTTPTKKTKSRTVHTVQQAETVEDMGSRMPRIYAALDNNQAEFQSHMIEVEGMTTTDHLLF